jgi:hypothetical protein
MKKTPLQQVNERFGTKDKLVDKLAGMVDREGEDKDEFKGRLLSMANSKLLRLHDAHVELSDFGGKDKLVSAILKLMNKAKDVDYQDKLSRLTPVRLLAMHREQAKRA